jgi:hypothetical protein
MKVPNRLRVLMNFIKENLRNPVNIKAMAMLFSECAKCRKFTSVVVWSVDEFRERIALGAHCCHCGSAVKDIIIFKKDGLSEGVELALSCAVENANSRGSFVNVEYF